MSTNQVIRSAIVIKSCLFLALSLQLQAAAQWELPAQPDPSAILNEAGADIRAGRYADANAKHLWFHRHALEFDPALYGVRLIALRGWYELGKVYPPAMKNLKELRDEAAEHVIEGNDDMRRTFHDMRSINEKLGEDEKTVEVFIRLDKEFPEVAKEVYDIAQPVLVKAKKFNVCGRYLEPERLYGRIAEFYLLDLEYAQLEKTLANKRFQAGVAEHHHLERSAVLISLLVLNDRKPEAEKLAEIVRSKSKHPRRDAVIDAALQGRFPKLRIGSHPVSSVKVPE